MLFFFDDPLSLAELSPIAIYHKVLALLSLNLRKVIFFISPPYGMKFAILPSLFC